MEKLHISDKTDNQLTIIPSQKSKSIKGEYVMDNTEKKLNQIINLLNLLHSENIFMFEFIKTLYPKEEDRKVIADYIEKCNIMKQSIISGMYEDEINITH